MENSSHAFEQLIWMAPSDLRLKRPVLAESAALGLPEDSHPSLFNPEEPKTILFQVAYY